MSEFEKNTSYYGFKLKDKEYISDIKAECHIFVHERTGAKLFYAKTDDPNKVFYAAFRTPSQNSRGTAHITEHSVLCGSAKYPVKEPFNELAKGSLNTFLNAMTYPDKTIYPIASMNDKDFHNLKDVYLDAVFNPLIYDKKEIFMQEGHHIEIDEKTGALSQSGVVYNEMKGAYSDPIDVIVNAINKGLFKNSPYKYDSGGCPDDILDLTYEEFLDFHKKFYHPSNCFFYFYGNMDMGKCLKDLEENYLYKYDRGEEADKISPDESASEFVREKYFVASEEDLADNCMYAYTKSCGLATNPFNTLSMSVLDDILMGSNSAPLKKALIESGLCKDVMSWVNNDTYENFITFIGRKCPENKEDEFFGLIEKALGDICEKGIDKKLIEAVINSKLFFAKEEDFGYRPKGLRYGIAMSHSWLNGGNPFEALKEKTNLEKLRDLGKTGYFEELIRKNLIENKRITKVSLYPDTEIEKERDKVYRAKMAELKNSLSDEDFSQIRADEAALKRFWEIPDSKEDLEKIPIIDVADIERKAYRPEFSLIDSDLKGMFVPLETEGMEYIKLLFDAEGLSEDEEMWLGFLCDVMGTAATKSYSYEALPVEIDTYTGGISVGTTAFSKADGTLRKFIFVSGKALTENREKLFELTEEILFTTVFDDKDTLIKILDEKISLLESILIMAGHSEAVTRSLEGISQADAFKGKRMSARQLRFLKELRQSLDEIGTNLKGVYEKIFTKSNLFVLIGGEEKILAEMRAQAVLLFDKLPQGGNAKKSSDFTKTNKKTALSAPSTVMYNAAAASYRDLGIEYSGSAEVAVNIVNLQYLWNSVRVAGGAYGCGSGVRRDGFVYFYSYRDPNIDETYRAFAEAGDFLRNFDCNKREMAKFIIGTVSTLDKPKTNSDKLHEALKFYMLDKDFAKEQKIRDEILSATVEDIRKCAEIFEAAKGLENICSVGAEILIEKSGIDFDVREKLI